MSFHAPLDGYLNVIPHMVLVHVGVTAVVGNGDPSTSEGNGNHIKCSMVCMLAPVVVVLAAPSEWLVFLLAPVSQARGSGHCPSCVLL